MKVIICKFFQEKDIERQVGKLVLREKKQAANNLRVFCVDEQVRKRLVLAGIGSEILDDFRRIPCDDEANWEKAYQISDELHSSAENNSTLKFSGINFLSLEYNMFNYVFLIKFAGLCRQMAQQNCRRLILVLTGQLNLFLPDINSPKIKTLRYRGTGDAVASPMITRLIRRAMHEVITLLGSPFILAGKFLRKSVTVDNTASARKSEQIRQGVLLVTMPSSLYLRPTLAIYNECLRNGLRPHVATYYKAEIEPLHAQNIDYSLNSFLASLIPHTGKLLWLLFKLSKHINSFFDNGHHPGYKSDEFSVEYLYRKRLLRDLPFLCAQAISSIAFLERLINNTSPDIICVMPDGHFQGRMASALARTKYNIPTLAGSDAVDTDNARSYMRHFHADMIAAMGERAKGIYVDCGIAKDRIVVTGVAHFDRIFNRDREQDNQVLSGYGIDPGKKTVVVTTQPIFPRETEEVVTRVINTVLKVEDIQLVIKVHPREAPDVYRAIAEKYPDLRIIVVKDIDLYALFGNCELLIAKSSTTALEAMIADIPVITFNLSGEPVPVPYDTEGAAIGVYRAEDVEPTVVKALYDEETRGRLKKGRDEFVRNWAGEPDGKASQRIVTLIKEMITASAQQRREAI